MLGNEQFGVLVDESDPMMVYSCSATKANEDGPSLVVFSVSSDGGKNFKNRIIGENKGFSNRIITSMIVLTIVIVILMFIVKLR